ncbi:MAG: High-affinity zinc uptake system protein ZnuA [Alphaproteobacteria bacterium MarineAlpha5_Bin9]|nr:MAG: High-affinity zinc uptake system protein ZnuA [Alphaproteobacteria bacterium MarineAlpha5_Bin9]
MKQNKTLIKLLKILFFSIIFIITSSVRAELKVVTTIKPIHSLITNVMHGINEPNLIIEGSTSPHNFTLKPSHAKLLEEADIIFWIGEGLETFMEKPLDSIVKNAKIIEFMDLDNIEKLKFREENIFDDHNDHDDHDDHGDHDDHDDHDDHGDHDDHDDHGDHDDHIHGEFDAHIWLDPINAKEMIHKIAHELSELDPVNKQKYFQNADKTIKALDQLIFDIDQNINKEARFVVFHDAYQYFEKRFGIYTSGALTLNTDVLPGAKQISDIQSIIKEKRVNCIFSEPQFNPKIIETIAQDTGIKTGIFDPLGANIESDKKLYFKLLNNLTNNLENC